MVSHIYITFKVSGKDEFMSTLGKLELYAKHNLNVLLIGLHGIGKSTIVKSLAEKLNLRFKYYSSSTLDPFTDIVGIPVPDKDNKTMNFYRSKDLEDAEFLMFDELNRAHPRVLNAVLEIIQFKTVNGTPLPKLKMVWGAINPPGEDYQVEELDPALVDRFHIYFKMNSELNLKYLEDKSTPEIAKALYGWWNQTLNAEQRRICTPRRIEYLAVMMKKDIPIYDAFPQGHLFPVDELIRRVRIASGEAEGPVADHDSIVANKQSWIELVRKEPKYYIPVHAALKNFEEFDLFECRDLLESLPKDLVNDIGTGKWNNMKKTFLAMFEKNHYDARHYPKIFHAFAPKEEF